MKTSELIAEILVIGIGATAWVLLLLVLLCPSLLPMLNELTYLSLLPAMAVVYVAGIMTDKLADLFFEKFIPSKYKGMLKPEIDSFKNSRDRLIEKNDYVQIMYMSSQSRKKIMRGWVFNFFGLLSAVVIGGIANSDSLLSMNLSILLAVTFLLFGILCLALWRSIDFAQKAVFERLRIGEG